MAQYLTVPRDIDFNGLLVDICGALDEQDYRNLRLLASGQNGLSTEDLAAVDSPQQLFEKLKDKQLLNQNNILYLQCLLWRLGKRDSFDKAAEFARKYNGTVYLDTMSDPPNGYVFVGVHIRIPDHQRLSQCDLRQLMANVAAFCGIPVEEVKVAGVQESGSVTVKLIVPIDAVSNLKAAIELYPHVFLKLNIDYFIIDRVQVQVRDYRRFVVTAVQEPECTENEQQLHSFSNLVFQRTTSYNPLQTI